jgi:hypothetical protein
VILEDERGDYPRENNEYKKHPQYSSVDGERGKSKREK